MYVQFTTCVYGVQEPQVLRKIFWAYPAWVQIGLILAISNKIVDNELLRWLAVRKLLHTSSLTKLNQGLSSSLMRLKSTLKIKNIQSCIILILNCWFAQNLQYRGQDITKTMFKVIHKTSLRSERWQIKFLIDKP